MRRAVTLTAVLALAVLSPPVRAQEAGTPCTFEVAVTLSPGLSRSPSSGTFSSNGESGRIECRGSVGGQPVTGPGTMGAEGRYGTDRDGDSCRSRRGQGDGVAHITLPVEGGSQHVDDPFTLTYRVDGRRVVGEIKGQRFTGTFDVTDANGDCFRKAITRIRLRGEGLLR